MGWIGSYCIVCKTKLVYKDKYCVCRNARCVRYGLLTVLVFDEEGKIQKL